MANASTNQHFFQPLLNGFQSHLKIPVKFFSEHIEAKHEGKTVKLQSDASKRTWEVKMDDNILTEGWKEFVEAHDLRIGDLVVFRHEGDMFFHVIALGPHCCEIQYSQSTSHEEGEESDDIEISPRPEKEVEENVQKESDQSSSDLNCFSQTVTRSNISLNQVTLPKDFAKRNGLDKGMHEIVLRNEEGKSWESKVKSNMSGQVFICGGWTSLCSENKLKVGDSCTFKLLQNASTPVFQLCSRSKVDRKKKIRSADNNQTGENLFVTLTPTQYSLENGKQYLGKCFSRANMLNKSGKIILMDKDKVEWLMKLKVDSRGAMTIYGRHDWKSFCAANEVGAGESMTLELLRGGTSPFLKFCSKMAKPTFEAEDGIRKKARIQNGEQETDKGEPSRESNKSSGNQGNVQQTQPCSVKDQVAKVKETVVDTLTSIRRFLTELETKEQELQDSLQDINKLERGEDNGNY
ncbi:PREDICTED: B3 domain-containing protein REM8-like isoform X2 [Camelina sativa]|uniref:B3 domain-containing protein REM8-like isoform X2 n=1 Tax=Camelina sativa TaxID=90675 RepID=A0ABM0UWV8_CAMSA|nr:PREDICTED: B3 domain-containing protein REM8-like isoform X2 [Camelina sativa]